MPKVSVIITVYNSEKFIEKCARSLFEQTLADMEFVFVNDGTPDGSIQKLTSILEDYPQREAQVTIVNMGKNSGPAAARTEAIRHVTGEYVIHCDSDDYVDHDFYRIMYETASDGNYDIVISDYYEGSEDAMVVQQGLNNQDLLLACISGKSSLWNKLVRLDLVKNPSIVFPTDDLGEDMTLVAQYSLLARSVYWIHQAFYYYVRRPSSFLGNRLPEAMLDKQRQVARNFNIVIDAIKRHGRFYDCKDGILHQCLYIKNLILPALPFTDSYSQWKQTYEDVNSKVLLSKVFSLREKINFVITYCGLYPLFYRIKNRV